MSFSLSLSLYTNTHNQFLYANQRTFFSIIFGKHVLNALYVVGSHFGGYQVSKNLVLQELIVTWKEQIMHTIIIENGVE